MKKKVWRVDWNVTGTTLACATEDGLIQLWKIDFLVFYFNFIFVLNCFENKRVIGNV